MSFLLSTVCALSWVWPYVYNRFLSVGQVVMEVIKLVPEVDMVVQSLLRSGYQSMMSATTALDTVEGETA